jgi:hypothetical protein
MGRILTFPAICATLSTLQLRVEKKPGIIKMTSEICGKTKRLVECVDLTDKAKDEQ